MKTKEQILENTIKRCREKHIIIPTYKQMRDPELIPEKIRAKLENIGLWDLNSLNMFRITWKNEPVKFGGGFGGVNYIELPTEITGVNARILMLIGKFFPTGSHKVGATFGPLVEKLVSGQFDPTTQKALWPSTGNYCRGGAYDSYLLGCDSIAVLPEEMSQERFDWLHKIGAEVYATPGCESNVKEIYDKAKELCHARPDEIVNLNQFSEIGNALWHYAVTGPAMEEVFNQEKQGEQRFSALFLTQGSAGTLGCADYLREKFPTFKVCAGEALQCPTLLYNGYGGHRIEGIGDKHVPWIHNIKNMDMVAGIDDEPNMHIMRLFNEPDGKKFLVEEVGVEPELVEKLDLLGISSIANLMGAIKMAKYYEMNENDIVFTVATDSMELYQSRIIEERNRLGKFDKKAAEVIYTADLMGIEIDHMIEMTYYEKRRMHNLKYFDDNYWKRQFAKVDLWDEEIMEFNEKTGLLKEYE
jgi:cysteine synthase